MNITLIADIRIKANAIKVDDMLGRFMVISGHCNYRLKEQDTTGYRQ